MIKTKYNEGVPALELNNEEIQTIVKESQTTKVYYEGDTAVAVTGFIEVNNSTVHIWLHVINHELFKKNLLSIIKDLKKEIKLLSHDYHRIQTSIIDIYEKWIQLLGLKKDCLLKNFYGEGKHVNLYSKVF